MAENYNPWESIQQVICESQKASLKGLEIALEDLRRFIQSAETKRRQKSD